MSAWVLSLLPLVLFAMISITSPDYLPIMMEKESGQQIMGVAVLLAVCGIFWIRRIIRVDV